MFTKYPTDHVIAACLVAYARNGNDVRNLVVGPGNKAIATSILTGKPLTYNTEDGFTEEHPYVLTEDDYKDARDFIEEFKQLALVMSFTKDNPFQRSNFHKVCLEIITSTETNNIGAAIFIPKIYADLEKKDNDRIVYSELATTSQYIGSIGSKVSMMFVVIKTTFRVQLGCYQYEGHDNNGNLVNFLSKHQFSGESFKIEGKVRKHENSKWTKGPTTVLNYVKLAKD